MAIILSRIDKIDIYFSKPINKKLSYKKLDIKDKKKVKKSENLMFNQDFITSRFLKLKCKKRVFKSVSHKNAYAVMSASKIKTGIDMEEIKLRNFKSIIEFCFSEQEIEYYDSSEDKILTFYKIYTAKEAILKLKNLSFCNIDKVSFLDKKISKIYFKINGYLICVVWKNK